LNFFGGIFGWLVGCYLSNDNFNKVSIFSPVIIINEIKQNEVFIEKEESFEKDRAQKAGIK